MKKAIPFIFFASILFPTFNFACSCILPSSFCESIANSNGDVYYNLIVRGSVKEILTDGNKKVKVEQVIYGDLNQDEIIIKNGFSTLFFNELQDGDEYIIALNEHAFGFTLVDCALSFLKIENETVKGKIAPGINTMRYQDLYMLEECGVAFDFISFEKNISLFPNPGNFEVNLKNISTRPIKGSLQIEIFDVEGSVLTTYFIEEDLLPEEAFKINIETFPSGVYVVKISDFFKETSLKLVKI